MGRTSKKLSKYRFQKGHTPHNKGLQFKDGNLPLNVPKTIRLTKDMYDLVTRSVDNTKTAPARVNPNSARLLRPKAPARSEIEQCADIEGGDEYKTEMLTNRVINVGKNAFMWNTVFREHMKKHPACKGFLSWDHSAEQQFGWAWREVAVCSECCYRSKLFNLFDDVEWTHKGRNAAKINIGLQIGLTHTPISTSSFQKLCLSCNIPCPSTSGMQHTANVVGERIEEENKKDLSQQRQLLREVNSLRGDNPNVVNVQADCVYNNALYSGVGKTPFRPATQCTYTLAENTTYKHKIINAVSKNKLCSNINKHKLRTKVAAHTGHCSANIEMQQDIGDEQKWAQESLLGLNEDLLDVKEITTDPDSSAFRAAESLYEAGITKTEPEHFLDTRHVTENHRKFMKNLKELKKIMPARLQRDKDKMKDRFANDMSKRCQAEYDKAFEKCVDFDSMKRSLSFAADAVVNCYFDDHNLCSKHSFVCSYSKRAKTWIEKSAFLRNNFRIERKDEAEELLRQCVQYRLGPAILSKTPKNTNTQKVEGTNRAIRTTVAKNVTYRRNYSSRVHTAIHNVNHGPGESITRLCRALGCPVQPGTRAAKSLKKIQDCNERHKGYKLAQKYLDSRCRRRHEVFSLWEDNQEQKNYEKNKLLPIRKPQCSCLPHDRRRYLKKCKNCTKK